MNGTKLQMGVRTIGCDKTIQMDLTKINKWI